jgi:dolichol-phosphate mannosyltransferase
VYGTNKLAEREASVTATPGLSILVPTYNEAGNIAELVTRIEAALQAAPEFSIDLFEIIFIDDSDDDTPQVIARVAECSNLRITCIHREDRAGGLGGAVILGVTHAKYDFCLVIDADLQHPPEKIVELYRRARRRDVDIVVASRYAAGGASVGLGGTIRHAVSRASILLVKAMFPIRLHACTDPMTGFFLFDRHRIDLAGLRPQGFKILLEMLARQRLRVTEVPFEFAQRFAGESKASLRQGLHFLRQLAQLRFGHMSGFALVGGLGAIVNVALVWLLTKLGLGVLAATFIGAEVTIVGNFLLQDRFVFGDLRSRHRFLQRFARSFVFNNAEAAVRIVLVVQIVRQGWMTAAAATAALLAVAFVVRYIFHALVVYAPSTVNRV